MSRWMHENYEIFEKPGGAGAYGVVYKARCRRTGELVALKKIRTDMSDEGITTTSVREIALLRELKDWAHKDGRLVLVFEWIEMDLSKKIERGPLPSKQVKQYLFQLLKAMDYCFKRAIMHRDLKPANLLVEGDDMLKVADFGLGRTFGIPIRPYTHEVVTLYYRAPEILLGAKRYTPSIDMWSIGTIFAEMVLGHVLWPGDSEIGQVFQIFQTLGTPLEEDCPELARLPGYNPHFPSWPQKPWSRVIPSSSLDEEGIDLLSKMLQLSPSKRISAKEALVHPYFDDLRGHGEGEKVTHPSA